MIKHTLTHTNTQRDERARAHFSSLRLKRACEGAQRARDVVIGIYMRIYLHHSAARNAFVLVIT